MSSEPAVSTPVPNRARTLFAWFPLIVIVWLVAVDSLWQLRQGETRAIPLPFSRRIYAEELADARASAETWFVPAIVFLGLMTVVIVARAKATPLELFRRAIGELRALFSRHPFALSLFTIACLLDFASTLLFCLFQSLLDELHPAIRLMAYAYGLVAGILLGKLIQAFLVLALALWLPRIAVPLIWATGIGYLLAALWNFSWL